ncbi:REP-associated tyrosine transposase [Methylomonas koyamae]|uniref:REP-associated tyrosine transposase n=1 Tax=Methylomonas koyamae TaxID=702114 RepID=UPI000BC33428|nr:transposase [Methylomonas koyamae]ATG92056.1 transposase [Methylomonas koyamae]
MTEYRRHRLKGGCYFFTVNLAERNRTLLTDKIELLRESFRNVKDQHPFNIDAIVVLPEHLHTIWTLPEGDDDFSCRWRLIKTHFTKQVEKGERISKSRERKQERGIWQRRFWEHRIRNEDDFVKHVDYIHYNPVKHGYVRCVADWRYSSFHDFVKRGVLPENWAGGIYPELDLA